jgi:transcription elongation factor GreA-like protein
MATIDDALKLVNERRFSEIEDLWTEMITDVNVALDDYLSITDAVHKTGDSSRATLLLELLSEHLESKKLYNKVIIILKHMLRYDRESAQIRKKLIGMYRKHYRESVNLEEYLECSGLNGSGPIMKAIQNFEDYIHYDVGRAFYFERYGTGQVVAAKPEKKEIVVDFERKEKHFLTIDIAKGLLTPITKDHFLYVKQQNA